MRKLMALLWALMMLAAARAEGLWTEEAWTDVRSELYSDASDPVPPQYRLTVSSRPTAPTDEDAGLTVLLMASDAADMTQNFGRTDLLVLCRLEYTTGNIRLLFLPEEVQIALPGLPGAVMLRHVNCFGGPLLTLNAVNAALGTDVGRYCAVNYAAFEQIVDLLGGVRMELSEGEAQALDMTPGENRLNGIQALRYVRLRQQGDGSRRAGKLIASLADAWTVQGSVSDVYRMLDLLLPLLDTNLTTKNVVDAAVNLIGRDTPGTFSANALLANADGALGDEALPAVRAFLDPEGAEQP